jgi:4-aminobutyrate aminotransferase-like enzyme
VTSDARLPRILHPPPGPRSRALAAILARHEAPGVNTVSSAPGAAAPILWQAARGANVVDVDGNRYVDLTSGFGVAAIGHRHPAVTAAIRRQSGLLLHGLGDVHAHPTRVALAERLAALVSPCLHPATPPSSTPEPAAPDASTPPTAASSSAAPRPATGIVAEAQIFFATSGAEAVEIALKTALAATGRPGIVAFTPSYHGLTLGALAATSRPEFRQPFAAYLHPHVRHLPYGCPPADLAAALSPSSPAGEPATGAVLLEPIVGREGVILPPPGWLAAVARLCRQAGALLIADEIFTGFGRTGDLFVVAEEGIRPDLLCCGKALGGGLPIAAVLARRELFEVWATDGEALHTSTFLANPLACAAALAVLDVLERERLAERARRLGTDLGARIAAWTDRFPAVVATRGRGLLWGIELRSHADAAAWVAAALRRGVLLLAGGPEGRVAQIVPPLTIAEPQLAGALDLLEQALAEIGPSSSTMAEP